MLSDTGRRGVGRESRGRRGQHRLDRRGPEGLRVADASIMPTVPSCNTNASSVMIGEKAAGLLTA